MELDEKQFLRPHLLLIGEQESRTNKHSDSVASVGNIIWQKIIEYNDGIQYYNEKHKNNKQNKISKVNLLFGFKLDIGAINSALSLMAKDMTDKKIFINMYENYSKYLRTFGKTLEIDRINQLSIRNLQRIKPNIDGVHSCFSTLYRRYLMANSFEKHIIKEFLAYAIHLLEQSPNAEKKLLYRTLKIQLKLIISENSDNLAEIIAEARKIINESYVHTMLKKKFFNPKENSHILNIILAEYGELVELLKFLNSDMLYKKELEQKRIDTLLLCFPLKTKFYDEKEQYVKISEIESMKEEITSLIGNNNSIQFVFNSYLRNMSTEEIEELFNDQHKGYYLHDIELQND